MTRTPPHRATPQKPEETPVVLPHVVITVTEAGALHVTVDGTEFPPPSDGETWTRSTFGTLLDTITADRMITVRIEVRETDDTVFTDIIRARRRTPPPAEAEPREPASERGKHTTKPRGPALVEVTADGFVPGEDVAVAVIVSHTDATSTGTARALLDLDRLRPVVRDGTGEVVLLGRVSGTLHVRRLP
ncbi:hypothetical protein [Sediminivirga luteola]|uniref:hypothetical protein n=1 Tax=Sediminivirga luteola TaxID=1774748 RepID=UPI001F5A3E12|nr:hypothetical protein [Sediminivirga luteola]MCI2264822.1 hypothetical protein [Sediminivirga luteola]